VTSAVSSTPAYLHPVGEGYWREKERVLVPSLKVAAHQCIIAAKSPYFAQFFREKRAQQMNGSQLSAEERTLVIDFQGAVCYEAFRKIIDYIYLDDHQWLLDQAASEASSSTEMVETIKLAK
jgi:BTB/POZ domain